MEEASGIGLAHGGTFTGQEGYLSGSLAQEDRMCLFEEFGFYSIDNCFLMMFLYTIILLYLRFWNTETILRSGGGSRGQHIGLRVLSHTGDFCQSEWLKISDHTQQSPRLTPSAGKQANNNRNNKTKPNQELKSLYGRNSEHFFRLRESPAVLFPHPLGWALCFSTGTLLSSSGRGMES